MIDKSTQEWFTTTGAARYIGASKDTIRALQDLTGWDFTRAERRT